MSISLMISVWRFQHVGDRKLKVSKVGDMVQYCQDHTLPARGVEPVLI